MGVVTTTHQLLTRSWAVDVEALETAISRFTSRRAAPNACQVALFEIAGDEKLHVNVTHQHQTQAASGWAGPAVLPQGFVHNRTFGDVAPKEIVRHIRAMVFSART